MTSYRYRLALLSGAAPLVLASAVAAQTVPSTGRSQPATYLSPVVVEAGPVEDPYAKPAATGRVGRDEIEQFGGNNLDDVLRAQPGVFTRDSVQNPGIAVNMRGLEGSGRVNMMVDGVRQNFRFTGHEAQGFAYVDPAFIVGVDINRGAVSGAGGAGALAGSVNFRTVGVDDLIAPGRSWGAQAATTYGTNGAGWAESAMGAVRLTDKVAVAGGISKRDSRSYRNGDGDKVPNTGQDIISGIMKLDLKAGDSHSLKLGANIYRNEFFANSYFQDVDSRQFTANYAYAPGSDLVDLRVNAYYNYVRMKYTGALSASSALGRVIEDGGFGGDVTNTSRFALGPVRVTASYGVEYFKDDVEVRNSDAVPDRGVNPSGESSIGSVFSTTTFSYGIADLVVGLRYDHFTANGTGSVVEGNPLGMPAGPYEVDRSEGRFNPKVTLAINATPWLQPFVTYGEAFRAPTVSELLTGGDHPSQQGGPRQSFFPNPFLEPEVSKGWEIGANIRRNDVLFAGDRLRFKGNYYYNRIDNYVTANLTGGVHFANNPGTSTVQGVELQGAYDAGVAFASFAYTFTDSELPSQVNGFGAQSYLPDHVASLTAGARFLDRALTVGGRINAVSESYVGEVNVAAGTDPHEDGYVTADLFANYQITENFELNANVTNLFDRAYSPALSTSPGVGGATGRGRTFLVTAKARF
ncbi:hemin receptor [Allostella sp. ATCC 35155]|nr:hemin receptor [Stella sp. ATCC 35155]